MITSDFLLNIRIKTEDLIKECQDLLQETEQVKSQLTILDQREKSIKQQDADVSLKILTLTKKEEALQGDKDTITKKFSEAMALEDKLNKRQQALEGQIKQYMANSMSKEKELAAREQIARIKEKELEGLWEREKTVKAQLDEIVIEKQMIEREKKIDRERKLQLDGRESSITTREDRMQRLISS